VRTEAVAQVEAAVDERETAAGRIVVEPAEGEDVARGDRIRRDSGRRGADVDRQNFERVRGAAEENRHVDKRVQVFELSRRNLVGLPEVKIFRGTPDG
jgi:hypothetical protein